MSVAEDPSPTRMSVEKTAIVLVLVFATVAVSYLLSQRQQDLRQSQLGLDGLSAWLVAEGQSVQVFSGGWPLASEAIGLNILPIYDTDLSSNRVPPRTKEELIMQQDEYDVVSGEVGKKVRAVNVLAVLPKWRSGMRLTGVAHPVLLSDPDDVEGVLASLIKDPSPVLKHSSQPFAEFSYVYEQGARLSAVTYASQTFSSPACDPIIGTDTAMLLGACDSYWGPRIFVLADPDLLNNHGLLLGDNAHIVSDLVSRWGASKQIIIDYSRRSLFSAFQRHVPREREWRDLLRFFGAPFTWMWLGLALTLSLVLWRSSMRFGPLRDSEHEISASKAIAIEARANLMRLSGQDGALVKEYVRARLAATASALFGPDYASRDALLDYVKYHHPTLAEQLATALSAIAALPPAANAGQALASVTELERLLEQITNEPRASSFQSRRAQG